MSLLVFTLLMLLLGFVAGVFGSILGLGGGIIITPIITTFFLVLILNMPLGQVLLPLLQQVLVRPFLI